MSKTVKILALVPTRLKKVVELKYPTLEILDGSAGRAEEARQVNEADALILFYDEEFLRLGDSLDLKVAYKNSPNKVRRFIKIGKNRVMQETGRASIDEAIRREDLPSWEDFIAADIPLIPIEPEVEEAEDDGCVYVGKRATQTYVITILKVLMEGQKAIIKARGKACNTAIDAAEMVVRQFAKGSTYESVSLSSELVPRRDQEGESMVSAITIVILPPPAGKTE